MPPGRVPWLTLGGLLALPVILIAIGMAFFQVSREPALWMALAIMAVLTMLAPLVLRRCSVRLEDGQLVVRAGFNTRRIPTAVIDAANARILDLDEHVELRPTLKTNGTALPGFKAGHFRTRGGFKRAFCLVTDPQRVLWLPVHEGAPLLLSLEHPRQLLDALNETPGM